MAVPARRVFAALFIAAAAASTLLAQETGETIVKRGLIEDDLYLAGGSVEVLATVEGDLIVAGGRVSIDNQVSEDVLAAGGSVIVRGQVGDDLRAVGGEVALRGSVAGDAVLAGGSVTLDEASSVAGRAWLAGGNVDVAGRVGGELRVRANRVIIAGEVHGDADIAARSIELRPGAVLHGRLTYRSPAPAEIDETARVEGAIVFEPLERDRPPAPVHRIGAFIPMLLSLLATVLVLHGLFPVFSLAAARTVQATPWKSLGLGLAVLTAVPLVVVLLLVTLVGIWLAVMLLALYFVALLAGFSTGIIYVADAGLRLLRQGLEVSRGRRILALIVAVLLVSLVSLLPLVGALVVFLLLLLGLGALQLQVYRRYTASE